MGGFSQITGDPLGSVVNANNVSFDGTERGGVVTLNGQLLIGSTALPHIRVGNLTSTGGTISISNGAGTINLEAGPVMATTYVANTGSATPALNILNVLGGVGISTSGAGNTLTITSTGASTWIDQGTSITLVANSNYFATAAVTLTMPASPSQGDSIRVIVDTASAVVLTANTGQVIRLGNSVSSSAGTQTNTARGDSVNLIFRTTGSAWIASSFVGNWGAA